MFSSAAKAFKSLSFLNLKLFYQAFWKWKLLLQASKTLIYSLPNKCVGNSGSNFGHLAAVEYKVPCSGHLLRPLLEMAFLPFHGILREEEEEVLKKKKK